MHLPTRKGLKILLGIGLLGLGMYVLNHLKHPVTEVLPAPAPVVLEEVPRKALGWEDDHYTKDGQPFTGILVENYPDGKPKQHWPMKNGFSHGLVEEWYPNGQQSVATHWEDGQRHGENLYWNPDGTVQKKQLWDHGKVLSDEHPPHP